MICMYNPEMDLYISANLCMISMYDVYNPEMDLYISMNLYNKYDMYNPGMDLYISANLYDKYDMYNPEMDLYIAQYVSTHKNFIVCTIYGRVHRMLFASCARSYGIQKCAKVHTSARRYKCAST
jgi:hypothetical protein